MVGSDPEAFRRNTMGGYVQKEFIEVILTFIYISPDEGEGSWETVLGIQEKNEIVTRAAVYMAFGWVLWWSLNWQSTYGGIFFGSSKTKMLDLAKVFTFVSGSIKRMLCMQTIILTSGRRQREEVSGTNQMLDVNNVSGAAWHKLDMDDNIFRENCVLSLIKVLVRTLDE